MNILTILIHLIHEHRIIFNIFYKIGLLAINSFGFSRKLVIPHSILNDNLARYCCWFFFPFRTWNIPFYSFLTCKSFCWNICLKGVCLYVHIVFLLLLLRFPLYFRFWHFNYNVSLCGSLKVHLNWNSLGFLIWVSISFLRLGKFSVIIPSN